MKPILVGPIGSQVGKNDNEVDEACDNLSTALKRVALVQDVKKARNELSKLKEYGPAFFNDRRPRKRRNTKRKLTF